MLYKDSLCFLCPSGHLPQHPEYVNVTYAVLEYKKISKYGGGGKQQACRNVFMHASSGHFMSDTLLSSGPYVNSALGTKGNSGCNRKEMCRTETGRQ